MWKFWSEHCADRIKLLILYQHLTLNHFLRFVVMLFLYIFSGKFLCIFFVGKTIHFLILPFPLVITRVLVCGITEERIHLLHQKFPYIVIRKYWRNKVTFFDRYFYKFIPYFHSTQQSLF